MLYAVDPPARNPSWRRASSSTARKAPPAFASTSTSLAAATSRSCARRPSCARIAGERARLLNAADVAFLCLPDAAAREAVALVTNPQTCLIDASTAHRTASDWVFGLPELAADQRARIRASKRIANPGCHSTGFILLVRPLVDAGLVSSTALLSATSITGYSGGGKKMIEQYEAGGDPRLDSPRPYGLKLNHKHLPEMAVHSRLETAPVFMPIVGNFLKGLSVAVPLHLATLKRGTSAAQLHAALERALCRRALRSRHAAGRRDGAGRRLLRRAGVQRHQSASTCSCSRARPRRS